MPTSVAKAAAEGAAIDSNPWRAVVGGIDVVFGAGVVRRLPELVERVGGRRVLIVTDPGVREACDIDSVATNIERHAEAVAVFDRVEQNPSCRHVEDGTRIGREHAADLLIGFGGGSAMDCAKGINFLLTNGGRMEDYWGAEKAGQPMLPSIGVPTTAGTGSEAQRYALIAQDDSHRKMACGDEKARFRTVLLDPDLTASTPRRVALAAGIDAITHAVESYVSKPSTTVSRMYAKEAWRLLSDNLAASLDNPDADGARSRMLVGAHLAGAAVECSMLGAAHACANPLTARCGITHGIAVAIMLPTVVRYNAAVAGRRYDELLQATVQHGDRGAANVTSASPSPDAARGGAALADYLEELWESVGLRGGLDGLGVEQDLLDELAAEAAEQWTAGFNPRAVDEANLLDIYREAY